MKDYVTYNGVKYQISTTLIWDTVWETMVFPIVDDIVSGEEVYKFRTFDMSESSEKHHDIYHCPKKYLNKRVIKQYLKDKETNPTDYEKFQYFFDSMNIKYSTRALPNNTIELMLNKFTSYYASMNGAVSVFFDADDESLIGIKGYGE